MRCFSHPVWRKVAWVNVRPIDEGEKLAAALHATFSEEEYDKPMFVRRQAAVRLYPSTCRLQAQTDGPPTVFTFYTDCCLPTSATPPIADLYVVLSWKTMHDQWGRYAFTQLCQRRRPYASLGLWSFSAMLQVAPLSRLCHRLLWRLAYTSSFGVSNIRSDTNYSHRQDQASGWWCIPHVWASTALRSNEMRPTTRSTQL